MKNLLCELVKAVIRYFNNASEIQERELHKEPQAAPRVGLIEHAETAVAPVAQRKRRRKVAVTVKPDSVPATPGNYKLPDTIKIGGRNYCSLAEVSKRTGYRTMQLCKAGTRGAIPRGVFQRINKGHGYYIPEEWVNLLKKCKDLHDLQHIGTWERGTDKKAKRVATFDYYRWTGLPADFVKDVSHQTLVWRLQDSISKGLVNTYTIANVRYVNTDELERWARWWMDHRFFPQSGRRLDFRHASDTYCVHENDLAWVWTGKFENTLEASQELLDRLQSTFHLPCLRHNGVRYYRADAIDVVKRHRLTAAA